MSGAMLGIGERMRWCDRASIAAWLLLGLLAPGCAGSSSAPPATAAGAPPPPDASTSPSLRDKVSSFFTGSSAKSPQPATGAEAVAANIECPYIDIRQGASTLTISTPGQNSAMSLKYQGTFVRAARDCAVAAGQMIMRVGVEGRIILGPAGGPGNLEVPLRIAVVDEKPAGSNVIVTRFIRIPVVVRSNDDNPTFTHIEEGLSFPLPPEGELDHYIVYIGFDPLSAEAQDKQRVKPKPKPHLRPTAGTG